MPGKAVIKDFVDIDKIKDRERVLGTFLVQSKQVPLNKNGKPYISMVVMNRTGSMDARVWDNVEQFASRFEVGDFVEVRSTAVEYQGRIQLKVEWLERVDATSVNPEDFLPTSPRDRGEMLSRVRTLAEKVEHEPLRGLILACLDDPSFREAFVRAPAAKTIHHAYLGGLLEHTLSVMELADRVSDLYPDLDRDLLLAGAFFHDVGKVRELGHERSFDYTDEGRLLGHINMGATMFTDWAEAHPGLPDDLVLKLTHMILAHHGSYEFGSPKRPKFTEALVLNYLDELDSKVQTFREIAAREPGQRWSSYQRLFDRYLFLDDATRPAPEKEDGFAHKPFTKLKEKKEASSKGLPLFEQGKPTGEDPQG